MDRACLRAYLEFVTEEAFAMLPFYLADRDISSLFADVIVRNDENEKEEFAWITRCESLNSEPSPVKVLLLGDAGQGKSSLVKMTSQRLAQRALKQLETAKSLQIPPVPIVAKLTRLRRTSWCEHESPLQRLERGLADSLTERNCPSLHAQRIVEHYFDARHQHAAWLLLDGFDEVQLTDDAKWIVDAIHLWKGHVVITSRVCDNLRHLRGFGSYRLQPFTGAQIDEFVHRWFGDSAIGMKQAARIRAMRDLAGNPLLLTLLCWSSRRNEIPPSVTRSELLHHVVSNLLLVDRDAVTRDESIHRHRWLRILAKAVGSHFCSRDRSEDISSDGLLRDFTDQLRQSTDKSDDEPRRAAAELIETLRRKRILQPSLYDPLAFTLPHLLFVEFLAAFHLSQLLEEEPTSKWWPFLSAKAWNPTWANVVQLVAGLLNDPLDLLKMLAEQQSDDYFRHRLALAGQCLGEITPPRLEQLTPWPEKITLQILEIAPLLEPKYGGPLHKSLPVLVRQFPFKVRETIRNWLNGSDEVKLNAAFDVVRFQESLEPAMVERLFGLAKKKATCANGVAVLCDFGQRKDAEVMNALSRWLASDKLGNRRLALKLVADISQRTESGISAEIDQQVAQMSVCDPAVRDWLLDARNDGAPAYVVKLCAETPHNIASTEELLVNGDAKQQCIAIQLLAGPMWIGVPPPLAEQLASFIDDPSTEVRTAALYAIRRRWDICWKRSLFPTVRERLLKDDLDVALAAAMLLAEIEASAVYYGDKYFSRNVLPRTRFLSRLCHRNSTVRNRVRQLCREFCEHDKAATLVTHLPSFTQIELLQDLLQDDSADSVAKVADGIVRLIHDDAKAAQRVDALLVNHLSSASSKTRAKAAEAMRIVCASMRYLDDNTKKIFAALREALDDKSLPVREAVLGGRCTPILTDESIVDRIIEMARNDEPRIRLLCLSRLHDVSHRVLNDKRRQAIQKLCESEDVETAASAFNLINNGYADIGVKLDAHIVRTLVTSIVSCNHPDVNHTAEEALQGLRASRFRMFQTNDPGQPWCAKTHEELARVSCELQATPTIIANGQDPNTQSSTSPKETARDINDRVFYDDNRRELLVDGQLVKKFQTKADNQVQLLKKFQADGWHKTIENPFSGSDETTAERRLSNTIAALKQNHKVPGLISFHGDGTSQGVKVNVPAAQR